ncbi:Qat anti-phage system TatD family nuclease QatD [Azospirillum rugosum]|uniref:Qat anti-phage system TatD family nuclease QatD n=1 Tax=Azospirillum rugosum TaxID=416170 RepID=UPI003613234D
MNAPPVDFHCHLDLYPDPGAAARRCRELGAYVLSITTTPKAWQGTWALARGNPRIRTALGLHPQIAHERAGELPLFDALLPRTRYVGEVGLDGGPECKAHWREQIRVFEHVLRAAAREGGRIISIHSRRAAGEVLEALARHPDAGVPVLHWFSGSKAELERAIALGCWFSVGPAMLAGKRGRDLVAAMPSDMLLTETDGPFAAIKGQPLDAADVTQARTAISSLWRVSENEAAAKIVSNFRNLVSVDVGGPILDGGGS